MQSHDLTGKKFGRLTGLLKVESHRSGAIWLLACECGNTVKAFASNVVKGKTQSCGCLLAETRGEGCNKSHGMSKTTIHNIWCGMRQRCENPKSDAFSDYGARGISVCERWQNFTHFAQDMGQYPGRGYSIDRIDNDKGYEPGNCRWATQTQQVGNRRNTVVIEHGGVRMSLKDWSVKSGIPGKLLHQRLSMGRHGDELFSPVRKITRQRKP